MPFSPETQESDTSMTIHKHTYMQLNSQALISYPSIQSEFHYKYDQHHSHTTQSPMVKNVKPNIPTSRNKAFEQPKDQCTCKRKVNNLSKAHESNPQKGDRKTSHAPLI